MKDAPILEDINLLVVRTAGNIHIEDKIIEDLKTGLDALIKLNIQDVFHVMDGPEIQNVSKRELSQYTHVISDTIDFPNYQTLAVDLMIPVISHEWLATVISQKRISPIRPFSVNPRDIFKDVIASCESFKTNDDDEELISVALRTFGGTYIHELKKSLTHFITDDLTTENSKLIKAFNEVKESGGKVRIVRKEWVLDCIKFGKLLPESDYDLLVEYSKPSTITPNYLSQYSFKYSDSLNLSKEIKECLSTLFSNDGKMVVYLSRTWDSELSPKFKQRTFDFLFDLIYFQSNKSITKNLLHHPVKRDPVKGMLNELVAITNYTGNARIYIEELLRRMGGTFTKTLKANNTHLVASKRIGKKYDFSKKWRLQVVSHMWVEDTFVHWKIMDEHEYSALPRSDKSVRYIGSLNFTGFNKDDETADISIVKDISDEIQASQERDSDANSVGIPVLTTTPIAMTTGTDNGSETSENRSDLALSNVPQSSTESIPRSATTKATLDEEEVMEKPKRGRKAKRNEIVQDVEKKDDHNKAGDEDAGNSIFDIPSDDAEANGNPIEIVTPSKKRKLAVTKTGKAKKINSNTKSPSPVVDDVAVVEDGMDDIIMQEDHDLKTSNSKKIIQKPNITGKPYDITAIVTGFDGELSASDKRELKKVGISIIDNANKNLNCIIAPSLLRTQKFLTALSFDPQYFLEPLFITDVLGTLDSVKKTADFATICPKAENYDIWEHIDYEKDIVPKNLFHKGTTKEMAKEYMKNSRSGLLEGYSLHLSSGLAGGFDTLKGILKYFGCKSCFNFKDSTKTVHSNSKEVSNKSDVAILVSNEKEKKLHDHFIKICEKQGNSYVIVQWDTVVMSIFEGSLKIDPKLALKTNI